MRKLILTVAMAAATVIAGAQTLTSKNGTPILPEANDWSIGFDAVPVLNTIGGVFHENTNSSTGVDYPSNNSFTLVGKLVKDENTAYRAKLGINFGSWTINNSTENFTGSDSAFTPSEISVSNMDITIGAGIQKWRGKGRVRGYYGAEAMIGFGGGQGDSSFTYLRPLNTNDFGGIQVSENNSGSTFGIGVNGFIGVEYFFGPKMSLSAEYTWGLAMTSTGESETSYSMVDASSGTPVVTSKTSKGGSSSNFLIGVGNTVTPNVTNYSYGQGSIVLSFYF